MASLEIMGIELQIYWSQKTAHFQLFKGKQMEVMPCLHVEKHSQLETMQLYICRQTIQILHRLYFLTQVHQHLISQILKALYCIIVRTHAYRFQARQHLTLHAES